MELAFWGQLNLQEGISDVISIIIEFHDYIIVIASGILGVVFYSFFVVVRSVGTDKYVVDSHFLEVVWTVLPMVVLLFMALPSLQLLYSTEDVNNSGVCTKVIGHQWYWEYQTSGLPPFDSFISADVVSFGGYRNLEVDNRIVVPAGVGSLFLVTSADVLHSWTLPSLGVKVDAIPGRINYLSVHPSSPGVFYGQCSELCGSNHSFIPIVIEAVSGEGYLYWAVA